MGLNNRRRRRRRRDGLHQRRENLIKILDQRFLRKHLQFLPNCIPMTIPRSILLSETSEDM
jgi:hypothetical protein